MNVEQQPYDFHNNEAMRLKAEDGVEIDSLPTRGVSFCKVGMMMWPRSLLVTALVLLLQAFSFNAYACLLPMSPTAESADMRDCPSSQEQAPRQLCDTFKTMGVSTSAALDPAMDSHTLCPEDALSVAPTVPFPSLIRSLADHPAAPPQEVLVDTIVLRL